MAKAGRPKGARKYKTVKDLEEKIKEYFEYCDSQRIWTEKSLHVKPYTISGLCVFLDIDRATLLRYEEIDKDFCNTIKRAKQKIENNIEENAMMGILNPTVSIFNLKNNFGWKDKTEQEITGSMDIKTAYNQMTDEELYERLKKYEQINEK